jgi:hypothetical protein
MVKMLKSTARLACIICSICGICIGLAVGYILFPENKNPEIIDKTFSSVNDIPLKYKYFDYMIDRVIVGEIVNISYNGFEDGIGMVTFSDGTQLIMDFIPFTLDDLADYKYRPFTYLLQEEIGYDYSSTTYEILAIKDPIW